MTTTAALPRAPERDPEATRANILAIATEEFAEKGFSGARVDDIAARTNTSKRMIYYYFGDKEGLFVAVIERDSWTRESWTDRGEKADVLAAYAGWHPQVRAIIEAVD